MTITALLPQPKEKTKSEILTLRWLPSCTL